jgi:hypothetical protein
MEKKVAHALGYFHKSTEKDGKKVSAKITMNLESSKKEDEERITKHLKDLGFSAGKPSKNKEGKVLISGTIWLNEEFPEGVANALDGKLVQYNKGFIKNVTKVNYSSYNPVSKKNSSVVSISLKEGSTIPFVRLTGNLIAVEKEGKKSYFLSNSILLETKDGNEWKEETIKDNIEELKSLGLYSKVGESGGKKYLNITKNVYAAKSSVLNDNDKLFKEIKENKPFVILEESIYKLMEGGSLTIDKNNNITPLGEDSKKVFKNVMDKLTVIPKIEKEDLYASNASSTESEDEEVDNSPVVY